MKKKRRKQHVRIYARIVSLFLVLTMLTNDFLGGGAIVWAAENQSSVETDAEQPAEGLTQETESDNNTQTEDADENPSEEEENGSESERGPIDEETGFEEESAQEDKSSGNASSGETEAGEILEEETPEAAGTQDTEEEITEDTVDLETEDDFLAEDEPQTVLILEEDVTKRTSNIKYFQNEDHSYTAAIYPYPIHYEEDGEWKEIDNQLKDGEAEEGTQFLENTQNLFQVKFAKKSNGSKLVKIKMDDFQISWDLKDARKVDAAAVNGNSRSGVASVPQHKEERTDTEDAEAEATIFTESPKAAQSGKTDEAQAEEAYGNRMKGKPEYNTGIGILPEEQEASQSTDDENEETRDSNYYQKIREANQEKMEVENLSSGVVYEEIFPYVDIEYVLNAQELKENIILKSAEAQNTFVFQIKVNGLELVEEGEQILFKDGEGNQVFVMQRPFAYDASGEFTDKVSMELVKGNGKKSELTVTVDREWLDEEGRQFPVTIDPAVQSDQDANSIVDAYALSGYPDNNYYARPILKTGVDATAGVGRSFIRFTLPQLQSGDMIVDASLLLYCYSTSTSAATVGVYQIMDTTWKSTEVTWKTQPVHAEEPEDYTTFTPQNGNRVDFSITRMAKYWYENNSNGGVMLRSLQEDGQYVEYVSADYPIEYMSARPSILITYINNNGLEDFWTYHQQDVGRAGTGYVNDYNGNLVFLRQSASTSGNRMPIALSHVYNSNDKDVNLGYGYGWRLNYHQTIEAVQVLGEDEYRYVDEDGTAHYFTYKKDESKWKDESGIDLELSIDTSSSERYVVKDKQDNKLVFDTAGRLIKIKDQNGNALSVSYTGDKIASITDGVGRKVTCTYDSSGLLSAVTGPFGTKTYTYSSSLLTNVTDEDGETVQYTYNSLREMTSAQDIDGYKIVYAYTSWTGVPRRIYTVTEYTGSTKGQSFQITRYDNRSIFTDNKNRKETYIFNNCGNTVSIQNENGYAQSSKYITEGSNKNKLSKVSKLQATVVNLLKNPNLESSGNWTAVQSSATATRKADSANAMEGNYVLYVTSSSASGSAGYQQSVSLKPGETYTFSAYVNTSESNLKDGKCVAQIKAVTASGTLYSDNCDHYETENGWYRLMSTITIPSGTTVSSATVYIGIKGAAQGYFDCFQLERSASASRYNLIENGDFSNGLTGFTTDKTNTFDRVIVNGSSYGKSVTYRRGVTTEPVLNMRSGPGTSYGIVATAAQGTYVTVVGEGTDSGGVTWYYTYIVKDGLVYSGYMISSYVSFSSEYYESSSTAVVDIENLNIRQGAGTGNTILVTIPRNTQVQVLDAVTTSNGQYWDLVYLTYGGTKYIGYALAEYVYTGYDGVTYDRNVMDTLDSNVFHMTGNPSQKKKLTQTINISGKANDTYMANVWATGYPVTEKNERKYGLEVEFVSTDGTTESYTSTFEAMTLNWQFLNDVFIAKKDYTQINVSCIFYYNCNAVAFDGLALYREDFAQSYMYDSDGNVTSVADNAKKQSSFEYDSNNNLTKMTDPKGNNFTYTYDSSHNVTAAVSAANVKYTFQYDSYGNPTETKVENPSDSSQYIRSTAGYTSNGNYQTSVTDALGNTSKSTYNETKGLLTKSTDADGNATNYTYDSMGRLTGVSAAVSEGITDGTAQVTYAYEDDSLKRITHNGYQYVFEEDGFGNSTGVYVAGAKLVERTYEGNNGNLSTEVYANGYTYLYSYDEFDRVTQINLKNSSGTEYVLYRYEYDKEGNLAVEYDIREDIGKGTIVTRYFYDLSGRLVYTSTDSEESYRYVYDLNDNLTKIVQKNPYGTLKAEYTYDKDSRETSTKIAYEAENSDSSTTDDSGKTYSTVYDALGRVTSQSWDTENAITTQYTYQAGKNGSQSSQVKKLTNGAGETSYTYDANGNITSLVSESETAAYAYDELNQLIREDSSERSQTITYVYDLGGNLKEKRIYSYQPSATDEELAQSEPTDTIKYGYDATWKDKLVSYDGQDITYDALGNPLSYRGMTLTWSKARELYSLKKSGITYRYRYDSDGMRTNKFLSNGTVTYQIEGNLIVGEQKVDSTGELVYEMEFLYDSSGNVLGMVYNGEEYYYEKNLQGDIVGLMDGTGTRIATYKYDSWGKTLRIFGSNAELGKINPFRYRSYYYDRETGLFYLNNRYYDPEVGRFLSADTTDVLTASQTALTDKNLYAYCDNNPVMRKDAGGAFWDTAIDVVSLCVSVAEVMANPADPWAWAGLAGDAIDLIPFVTGVGELTKVASVTVKAMDNSDDVIKATRRLAKSDGIKKFTGSYEIIFESGKNYTGKGGLFRSTVSAKLRSGKDKVTSISWTPSSTDAKAFISEYWLMKKRGVRNGNTYNRSWSPGRKKVQSIWNNLWR